MTYNVHSCLGMDGKVSPRRIARVIAQQDPDLVALQEVDVGRERTGAADQARIIANHLRMDHHFHPALQLEEERYGDAVLSRLPMRLRKREILPGVPGRPGLEPRGALWVQVQQGELCLQFITTHLGLSRGERMRQAQALLGPDWLSHPECGGAVVFCGDLNAHPRSPVYASFAGRFADAQTVLDGHRPRNTWFSRWPIGRIDHVFINDQLAVRHARVVNNALARVASDHLPLIVDLEFRP